MTEPVLRGLGAAPGVARGPAYIVRGPLDQRAVTPGSILVTRLVSPSIAPVLLRVAGVVVEEGGLLQHATSLAREFGIPAVVGLSDATTSLMHGELIEVRGDTGEVERLDMAPTADEVAQTLQRCLRQHLPMVPAEGDIDLSAQLFEFGLDSMSAIGLLMELEAAFSIRFPDQRLDPETFSTGNSLLAVIRELKAEQAGSTAPPPA